MVSEIFLGRLEADIFREDYRRYPGNRIFVCQYRGHEWTVVFSACKYVRIVKSNYDDRIPDLNRFLRLRREMDQGST